MENHNGHLGGNRINVSHPAGCKLISVSLRYPRGGVGPSMLPARVIDSTVKALTQASEQTELFITSCFSCFVTPRIWGNVRLCRSCWVTLTVFLFVTTRDLILILTLVRRLGTRTGVFTRHQILLFVKDMKCNKAQPLTSSVFVPRPTSFDWRRLGSN